MEFDHDLFSDRFGGEGSGEGLPGDRGSGDVRDDVGTELGAVGRSQDPDGPVVKKIGIGGLDILELLKLENDPANSCSGEIE